MKLPAVRVNEQGRPFLENGQMWMYRNNLILHDENVKDGDIVRIESEDGKFIASGFYSDCSHIAVRILSRNEHDVFDRAFFEKRIQAAFDFRKATNYDNLRSCRMIYSEADLLPGFIADLYQDILVTQVSCSGMEQRKQMIYDIIRNVLGAEGIEIHGIYERNDIAARAKEGLEQYKGFYGKSESSPQAVINENGLLLNVDIENGQKTGYFLDQKSNRMLIRRYAKGMKVLDCFTHTGGFALNAALGNAEHVSAVDVSKTALDQAYANACLNHLEDRMEFIQADVFEYLDEIQEGQFDLIILDPPAFTKSRKTVFKAYNGYKRINKRAMEVLKNGGYLATCSCSRYMETSLFEQMLKEAALEAGVLLKQVSVTQQNSDHPVLWQNDETSYLKFYIFQILNAC
ncbi:MAG: class I SAM-dependent rRNA methyltransferase [Erysipelotrichaceae bacterium]|nr:class I SAM-dependent rRNA methyltransferase [Erysipelotrichaceae bacterium]